MSKKRIGEINVVPFIDIMLVLLVIVLTTATFVNTSKVKIDVPTVSDGQNSSTTTIKGEKLNIAISKDGSYYYNSEQIGISALEVKLAELHKDTQIILSGDKKSNLNSFVNLLDLLQKYKLNKIYVIVEENK